jgi:hypothetical protein
MDVPHGRKHSTWTEFIGEQHQVQLECCRQTNPHWLYQRFMVRSEELWRHFNVLMMKMTSCLTYSIDFPICNQEK